MAVNFATARIRDFICNHLNFSLSFDAIFPALSFNLSSRVDENICLKTFGSNKINLDRKRKVTKLEPSSFWNIPQESDSSLA